MSLPLVSSPITATVTKFEDTMLDLAVHKRQLNIIKYSRLLNAVSVLMVSNQSLLAGPSTQVFTLSHTHILHTDPTLSRQIQELSIHRGDLDFIKYLVNKLSVDIYGELNDFHYLYIVTHMHTHTNT